MMKSKRVLYFGFVLMFGSALLAGCVTKRYKTPATPMDTLAGYRSSIPVHLEDSDCLAEMPWQQFFDDSLLRNLIDTVLTCNIDLQVAVKNVQKSYQGLRQSRAALAPAFSADAQITDLIKENNKPSYGAEFSLISSWEIDIWGKLLSDKRSNKAQMMADKATAQAVMTTLISQTAQAYYALVALDTQRDIILTTIQTRTEYLEKTVEMKQAARVNEVAVQQAVSQLAAVKAALMDTEIAIETTENQISLLMGRVPGKIERTSIFDLRGIEVKRLPVGYPVQLLANRPDVRAAELTYRSTFEAYNMSRAALYPSLTISAAGGYTTTIHQALNLHFMSLNLLGGLTQPIFNARKLRTQKNVAKLTAEQAELQFKQSILQAGMEVSNALVSASKYTEKGYYQQEQLDALSKAYDYSIELFDNGYATYLDVLVAQTGVYDTQISLINTFLSGINQRIELYRALGGGMVSAAE